MIADACATGAMVITTATSDIKNCQLFDAARLKKLGAVALYRDADGLRMISASASAVAGRRLWNSQ